VLRIWLVLSGEWPTIAGRIRPTALAVATAKRRGYDSHRLVNGSR
jgi:hypothetical protein